MSCNCTNDPNSPFCPHLMFGVDGTYLTCANRLQTFDAVDLQPLVEVAETETDLQLDLTTNSLIYTNERAANGTGTSTVIPLASIAATFNLQDLRDVNQNAPNTGDFLAYDEDVREWGPYTTPVGTIVSNVGIDVDGHVVKQDTTPTSPEAAIPIGGMILWSGLLSAIPTGFLLADGGELNRSVYAAYFAVVGTQWGAGNGTTTFNKPNNSGRVPVGYNPSDSEFNAVGKTGGEKYHTISVNEMPSHGHGVYDPGHDHQSTRDGENVITAGSNNHTSGDNAYQQITWGNTRTSYSGTGIGIYASGGSQPHNNIQPYITIPYIVRVQ